MERSRSKCDEGCSCVEPSARDGATGCKTEGSTFRQQENTNSDFNKSIFTTPLPGTNTFSSPVLGTSKGIGREGSNYPLDNDEAKYVTDSKKCDNIDKILPKYKIIKCIPFLHAKVAYKHAFDRSERQLIQTRCQVLNKICTPKKLEVKEGTCLYYDKDRKRLLPHKT